MDVALASTAGVTERISAQMAAQLLMSLEGFHKNGIILRDVKEDNIMINERGYLRIVDFGLALKVPRQWGADPQINPNTKHGLVFSGSIPSLEENEIPENKMLNSRKKNHRSHGVRLKLKPAGTPRTLP